MNQSWNSSNGTDYSSHLLSASLPISIQHILKYSESIKKESSGGNVGNSMLTGSDLLGLKNGVGSNLLGNVASMVNQHHLNHHQHHNFMNGNDNNMDHHLSSTINIPSHNSMLLGHNQSSNGLNMKSSTIMPIGNGVLPNKSKKERKKSVKQPNAEKKPKKKKPPKERKPRPKVRTVKNPFDFIVYQKFIYSPVRSERKQLLTEQFFIAAQSVKWPFLCVTWSSNT